DLLRPPRARRTRGDQRPPGVGAPLHQRAARPARGRTVRREALAPREARDAGPALRRPETLAPPEPPRLLLPVPKDPMTTQSPPRILLAGGGSAGHVSPLLATAAQISR